MPDGYLGCSARFAWVRLSDANAAHGATVPVTLKHQAAILLGYRILWCSLAKPAA
ncbi:hypothetical protein GCM10022247_44240 [Allokutzneria multivorans]|uniref:Uncharacterized protein n=1 Tax=Allokutzneria multivorans TaxID=1142134 RepID=A0ABP7SU29_9PSEU